MTNNSIKETMKNEVRYSYRTRSQNAVKQGTEATRFAETIKLDAITADNCYSVLEPFYEDVLATVKLKGVHGLKAVTVEDIVAAVETMYSSPYEDWFDIDTTNSVEGEINPFKAKPKGVPFSIWTVANLLSDKAILCTIEEGIEGAVGETKVFDLETLIVGYFINAEQRPFDACTVLGDAVTGSCVFQYGLFGEIVYG